MRLLARRKFARGVFVVVGEGRPFWAINSAEASRGISIGTRRRLGRARPSRNISIELIDAGAMGPVVAAAVGDDDYPACDFLRYQIRATA